MHVFAVLFVIAFISPGFSCYFLDSTYACLFWLGKRGPDKRDFFLVVLPGLFTCAFFLFVRFFWGKEINSWLNLYKQLLCPALYFRAFFLLPPCVL